MARKTKDELENVEENVTQKKTRKTAATKKTAAKSVARKEPTSKKTTAKKAETDEKSAAKKTSTTKKTTTAKKSTTTKKTTTANKSATAEKVSVAKKTTSKKAKAEEKPTTKKATTSEKSTATKKATTSKKSTVAKKSTTTKKSTATKKATTAKEPTTKKTTTKKSTATKKTTTKKSTTSKQKSSTPKADAEIIQLQQPEYYDLPYRYNDTVVKVLAQEPNTLFVYWDISDKDRENYEKLYGKLFFYNTRPVLIVHNLTDNYSFEVDIDDFANNWYVHVNNSKCQYSVELGRRPKYEKREAIPVNYLNVAFSNTVEIPNDHILYFKRNNKIYFKNVKTNKVTEKTFNANPDYNRFNNIYKNYNISDNSGRFDFNNPSSQNPTSTFL